MSTGLFESAGPFPVGAIAFAPHEHTKAPAIDGLPKPTPQEWAAWEDLRTDIQRQRFLRDRPHADLVPLDGVRFVGLGHKARHGKDHAAMVIHAKHPLMTGRYSIANGIRAYCRVQYGMTTKDAPLLQKVGTEIRQRDPETWIRALYWQIAEERPAVALVTDIRTQAEAAWIKQMGGQMLKVQRFNADGTPFVDSSRDPQHITETDLNDYRFDHTILNAGTVAQFDDAVLAWFDETLR